MILVFKKEIIPMHDKTEKRGKSINHKQIRENNILLYIEYNE